MSADPRQTDLEQWLAEQPADPPDDCGLAIQDLAEQAAELLKRATGDGMAQENGGDPPRAGRFQDGEFSARKVRP